jgi:hypothetical protein
MNPLSHSHEARVIAPLALACEQMKSGSQQRGRRPCPLARRRPRGSCCAASIASSDLPLSLISTPKINETPSKTMKGTDSPPSYDAYAPLPSTSSAADEAYGPARPSMSVDDYVSARSEVSDETSTTSHPPPANAQRALAPLCMTL